MKGADCSVRDVFGSTRDLTNRASQRARSTDAGRIVSSHECSTEIPQSQRQRWVCSCDIGGASIGKREFVRRHATKPNGHHLLVRFVSHTSIFSVPDFPVVVVCGCGNTFSVCMCARDKPCVPLLRGAPRPRGGIQRKTERLK